VIPVTAALMHITATYFITFMSKCFELAVATINAELRAILLNIIAKFYSFCATVNLHMTANCAHVGQFFAKFSVHRIAEF